MFQASVGWSFHDDRQREMRARFAAAQRRDAARAWSAAQPARPRSIRRSIGRSVVRMGEAIAAESSASQSRRGQSAAS
jgi:hypothetical protein